MQIGYARSSTIDQEAGFRAQIKSLKEAGCEKVFAEQVSSLAERVQLEAALEYAREGDTLVVTKLDRLARSVFHLVTIGERLEGKGVSLKVLEQAIDTSNCAWASKELDPPGVLKISKMRAPGSDPRIE